MKKKIKALHLASFIGNIGDVINHTGARRNLKENLNFSISYKNLEFRNFFWKTSSFDEKFTDLVNKYDLLIVGGGGFFELWPKNSSTGTSFNISIENLKKIKKPILFLGLGSDIGQGTNKKNIEQFKKFISYCNANDKIFLSVRNDGSFKILQKILNKNQLKKIYKIPDGGFFFRKSSKIKIEKKYRIGINLAGDMLNKRFASNKAYLLFLRSFSKLIKKTASKYSKIRFIFFSHIWKDYLLISNLMKFLPDKIIRENLEISELGFKAETIKSIEKKYQKCDVILANRFHSHILAIINNLPLISICNYPQISNFYKENKFKYPMYYSGKKKFFNNLSTSIDKIYSSKKINKVYKYNLNNIIKENQNTYLKINNWLKHSLKK